MTESELMQIKRSSYRLVLVIAALIVAMQSPVAADDGTLDGKGTAATFTLPYGEIVDSLDLPGGAIAARTTSGATFVAPIGTTPVLVRDELGERLGLEMPEPTLGQGDTSSGWTLPVIVAYLDAARSGLSLGEAAELVEPLRVSQAEPIDDVDEIENASCIDGENRYVAARQCVRRQKGQDDGQTKYVGDASWVWAEGAKNRVGLTSLLDRHNYPQAVTEIVEFEPKDTISVGSCSDVNLSIGGHGVSLGVSEKVCPKKITPDPNFTAEILDTKWQGFLAGGINDSPFTHSQQLAITKTINGAPSKIVFSFVLGYFVYCSGSELYCQISNIV